METPDAKRQELRQASTDQSVHDYITKQPHVAEVCHVCKIMSDWAKAIVWMMECSTWTYRDVQAVLKVLTGIKATHCSKMLLTGKRKYIVMSVSGLQLMIAL